PEWPPREDGVPRTEGMLLLCGVPGTVGIFSATGCTLLAGIPGNGRTGVLESGISVIVFLSNSLPQIRQNLESMGFAVPQYLQYITGPLNPYHLDSTYFIAQ